MSNQQKNNSTQVDDADVQGLREPLKHRSRNFYRKRPGGTDRQKQDLGEDNSGAFHNDNGAQPSNNADEINNQANDDDTVNNTRGPAPRGGFRRGRGRGRFARAVPFYNNYRQAYSPYTDYVNRQGGFYGYPDEFYGPSYGGVDDQFEQEGYYDYPVRGTGGFRGGRGRGGRRGRITKNENTGKNDTNEQQEGENNTNTSRQRRQRRTNDNGSGAEQQTDGAVTDDQQQEGSTRQQGKKSDRRRRRNTNASQSGVETEERIKSDRTRKPKDDETIVKYLLQSMVGRVARRLASRNRQRSRANTKEAIENNTDIDQSQAPTARRGGRRRRGGRPGNGYVIEQEYYDPYSMVPYYYGVYYDYGGREYSGRGRGRGRRDRGRFRQRGGGANKENQSQDNSEEKKLGESNSTGGNSQPKPAITEQVNQSS